VTTGTEIAQRALGCIGAHSTAAPASADSIVTVINLLNPMLEMWLSKGIQIGFTPLDVPGDELNETADSFNAIIYNLAIKSAPFFDNGKPIVSQELRTNAKVEFQDIKNLYQKITIPKKVVSSTLPVGAGNSRGVNNRTFFPKGATIDG